ncbi:hypothetical protein Tcan_02611 [Toxocara canis]|uniref:Uncharacterized protein n=1 Tax=Toxocara canis TaxID=6265 RepID=A0A0B2W4L1_TOXCA|nr:hypothetical protein Tcan_02611 [Toxocara canis]
MFVVVSVSNAGTGLAIDLSVTGMVSKPTKQGKADETADMVVIDPLEGIVVGFVTIFAPLLEKFLDMVRTFI